MIRISLDLFKYYYWSVVHTSWDVSQNREIVKYLCTFNGQQFILHFVSATFHQSRSKDLFKNKSFRDLFTRGLLRNSHLSWNFVSTNAKSSVKTVVVGGLSIFVDIKDGLRSAAATQDSALFERYNSPKWFCQQFLMSC